jgi:hypothetical protein
VVRVSRTSASTGRFLGSIAMRLRWREIRSVTMARPSLLVVPTGRLSFLTSTSGTPTSTTAKASAMRLTAKRPPPV